MTMKFFIRTILVFVSFAFVADNNTPVVKIQKPVASQSFSWNQSIRYSISVDDKEDGNSQFGEIKPNEIILKTKFLSDVKLTNAYIEKEKKNINEGKVLSLLGTSNCFDCHRKKERLIGPSFEQIAAKYPFNSANIISLTKKVIKGSSGVWKYGAMPPHPDLSIEKVKLMNTWILTACRDRSVNYIPGVEGSFKTIDKPVKAANNSGYVLTALYTDHGVNNASKKTGRYIMVLKYKNK